MLLVTARCVNAYADAPPTSFVVDVALADIVDGYSMDGALAKAHINQQLTGTYDAGNGLRIFSNGKQAYLQNGNLKHVLPWPISTNIPDSELRKIGTPADKNIQISLQPLLGSDAVCSRITVDCSNNVLTCDDGPHVDLTAFNGATLYAEKDDRSKWLVVPFSSGKASPQVAELCTAGLPVDTWVEPAHSGDHRTFRALVHLPKKKIDDSCDWPPEADHYLGIPNTLLVSYVRSNKPGLPDKCELLADASPTSPQYCLPYFGPAARGTVVPPNTELTVIVVLPPKATGTKVNGTGPVSITAPKVSAPGQPLGSNLLPDSGGTGTLFEPGKTCRLSRTVLAPRAPGPFNVTASLLDEKGEVKSSPLTAEFVVEARYIGAVRVGIGISAPTDASKGLGVPSYAVRPSADGGSTIHYDGSSPNFELTAGYSAFLFSHGSSGPWTRGQRSLRQLSDFGVALYGGIGVVAVTPQGTVRAVNSAYVGPEISGYGIAIDFLFGAQRLTDLANGYHEGTHLGANASLPTRTRLAPAVGVTLDFTSDVFKIAGVSAGL